MTASPYHLPVDRFTAYVDSRYNDRVHHNDPHNHEPYFELLYFIEGESHITIGTRRYTAGPGDLVVYFPTTIHEEYVQPGPYRIVCLRFLNTDVGGVPFPGPEHLQHVFRLPWRERFRNTFEQIVIENQPLDQWSAVMRGAYLTQFVVLLWRALSHCRNAPESNTEEKRMRIGHIIELIHTGMRTDLSLSELAGKAFMSESHFSHVFKDVTGVSPRQYVIESRIGRAREMLAHSESSVVDIAAELGYTSPQYFSRVFKQQTGLTPLEYRRRGLENGE
jgi:AraC-like DNA-binding protein